MKKRTLVVLLSIMLTLSALPASVFAEGTDSKPEITTNVISYVVVNMQFERTLSATGSPAPTWEITAGDLPSGVSMNSDGVISGTAEETGSFTFTVTATNTEGESTKELTLVVKDKTDVGAVVTMPDAVINEAYSQQINVPFWTPDEYRFDMGTLPKGMSINSDGMLTGTPTESGEYDFVIVYFGYDNGGLYSTYVTVIINIDEAPIITTESLPEGTVGTDYSQTLEATGYPTPSWSLTDGDLPNGLDLNADGTISGNPTAAGTFNFTVTASNDTAPDAVKEFSIVINDTGSTVTADETETPASGTTGTTVSSQSTSPATGITGSSQWIVFLMTAG